MPLYSQEFPKCPPYCFFSSVSNACVLPASGVAESNFDAQCSWLFNIASRLEAHILAILQQWRTAWHTSNGHELYSKPKQFESFVIHAVPIRTIRPVRQPTNAINKIQRVTSIYLLHVSAPRCHPKIKGIQVQHPNLGIALACWACIPLIWKTPWRWNSPCRNM
jgi:hypothetical protein